MDWMKIYIDDLLMSDLKDWQLMAIMRYQALYTQLEEMPNDVQLRRFLSKKERDFCSNYIEVIQQRTQNDIESANKKSKRNKKYYKKRIEENSQKHENSDVLQDASQDILSVSHSVATDKTRQDKTRIINNPSFHSGLQKSARALSPTTKGCRFEKSGFFQDEMPKEFEEEARKLGKELLAKQEYAKFRDYWKAKTGQNATKLDWIATWRNWLRDAKGGGSGFSPPIDGALSPVASDAGRHHSREELEAFLGRKMESFNGEGASK